MKVLFLDIDGVLNCHESFHDRHEAGELFTDQPDPDRVLLLEQICRKTGCKVVISSVWRSRASTIMWRYFFLALAGVDIPVIGKTPEDHKAGKRGTQIERWILENDAIARHHRREGNFSETKEDGAAVWGFTTEVSNICILDDDSDMEVLSPWLVQTSFDDGLQERHVKKAIKMLKKPFGLPHLEVDWDLRRDAKRKRAFKRDHHRCVNCGTKENLTIDHIVPYSLWRKAFGKGTTSTINNYQVMCNTCNNEKADTIACYRDDPPTRAVMEKYYEKIGLELPESIFVTPTTE